MSATSQAKILRVLEERTLRRVGGVQEVPVDVRLVAATNRDLEGMQRDGAFRQDQFFRLNVFTIPLPPLRERGNDILLLAEHFIQRFALEFRKDVTGLDDDVRRLLRSYAFPGNVRELRNLVERGVILADGPTLTTRELSDLPRHRPPYRPPKSSSLQFWKNGPFVPSLSSPGVTRPRRLACLASAPTPYATVCENTRCAKDSALLTPHCRLAHDAVAARGCLPVTRRLHIVQPLRG